MVLAFALKMVRKKVPSKLVIQADHVKSEKRLGSLKPSSCQHQDGRSRGPDMKKKMRRTRSIKLSDIESLKSSSPSRKAMSQSGKPPPVNGTTAAATPQKQFIVKITDGSPNYMKSTSSSEARKERSQAIYSNWFKRIRSFPAYLQLNPGGSEAEGTSVKKVCPHAYCSLNGHHHKPVPQLKGFLKARRRSLKVQRSIKLEVLSPRRTRPSGDGTDETRGLLDFSGDKPVIQEVEKGFFIEIGAVKTENGAYETEKRTENEGETACALLGEPEGEINESCFYAGHEAAAEQDSNNHVSESSSDESQESEIDFKENVSDSNAAEMDVAVGFVIEDEKDGDTDCSSSFSEKESNRSDIERESHSSMEEDDNISEATNMDWEEGQTLTSDIDAEADDLNKHEDKFWTKVEFTAEIEKLDWREDSEIIMSDDAVSNYTEEIPADEVLRELFAEETASSDMQCSDRDSESDIIPHYRQILESNREPERKFRRIMKLINILEMVKNGCAAHISAEALKGHQEDKSLQAESAATKPQVYENRDMIGTNKEDEIDQIILVAENNQELAVAEIPDSEAGDATEAQEQIVNAELPFEIHVSDSPESFSVADQDDAELNADGNHMTAEVCQLNAAHEKDSSSQDLVDDSTPTKPHDHQLDEQDETNNVIENENLFEEDQDEAKKIKILTAIDFEAPSSPRTHEINSARDDTGDVEETEVEVCNESDAAESFLSANNGGSGQSEKGNPSRTTWRRKRENSNPREPNFLPVVP
ncbi:hypothetical protein OIU78_013169, partial [Salix suchowensis]